MNTKDFCQIKETLKVLKGLPLSKAAWNDDKGTLFLHFGNMVEIDSRSKVDERGVPIKVLSGEYAFEVGCFFRFCNKDEVILAEDDFIGSDDTNAILARLDNPKAFIVDTVTVNHLGDVVIKFADHLSAEIRIDVSEYELCWRFFKSADDYDLLAVNGQKLE